MWVQFLFERFAQSADLDAIVWRDQVYNYDWLLKRIQYWQVEIASKQQIPEGSVVAIEADFSPNSIALLLALVDASMIVVPLTKSVRAKRDEFLEIAQVEQVIAIDEGDRVEFMSTGVRADHDHYLKLRQKKHPGLVLFSSGSTGKSKAAVHSFVGLLEKFKIQRKCLRTVSFLLYDHIGGINTLLYVLSNAGCVITVEKRTPEAVLELVEKYGAELLPTSPTFLNMILLSETYNKYDLSRLKSITYGTEPMPESTLKKLHAVLPNVQLTQTYGLSEVGILRSKSKSSDSLWVKIGGEGFETRIVDGILHIKAQSAMLGYLNAPSPFTDDGWFVTGDQVDVEGEYFRILGRKSELINVGGEKVYPAEVESVIREMPEISDVTVYSEKNLLLGQIVVADLVLKSPELGSEIVSMVKKHCAAHLQKYKVPVKIKVLADLKSSERFKKMRPQ